MEYILFVSGVIIIFFSLFLSYRSYRDDDDYYLESEMLAEIRKIKNSLIERKKDYNSFNTVLNDELDNNKIKEEITLVQDMIKDMEDSVSYLKDKMDSLDKRLDSVSSLTRFLKKKPRNLNKNESGLKENKDYLKIKKMLDQGFSLPQVAQKLDMGNREVELIWKLNSRGEE